MSIFTSLATKPQFRKGIQSKPELLTNFSGINDLMQPLPKTTSILSERIEPIYIKITYSSEGHKYLE